MAQPLTIRTPKRGLRSERGVALIVVMLTTMLLTALALTLVMVSTGETLITANYRNGQEALYAADAAVERVVQDLLTVAQWNDLLRGTGNLQSSFAEGSTTVTLADGVRVDLVKEQTRIQSETNAINLWGANNPNWRLYAYGPVADLLPEGIDSPALVAVWVGDDPSEVDGNPALDGNGVLTLHAEAWSVGGAHKVIEVTVARTASTEIERGFIAQRGQEEWNQRARKAAVQTPGRALTEMKMTLGSGNGLVTQ